MVFEIQSEYSILLYYLLFAYIMALMPDYFTCAIPKYPVCQIVIPLF